MQRPQAFIFDMDGTLCDTLAQWSALGPRYLRERGYVPDEAQFDYLIHTKPLWEVARIIKETYGIADSVDEICRTWKDMAADIYRLYAPLKEGVADFLAEVHEQNIPMVLLTNNIDVLAEALLKRCGIRHYFAELFCGYSLHLSKDEPTIFERALAFLGTARERTWMFEDSLIPLTVAKDCGMPTVALLDSHHGEVENHQLQATATHAFYNYDEVRQWFEQFPRP